MIARFKLSPSMIYLVEALKVEGYWSVKHREGSIQNKNLPFLNRIETLLKINKINVSKRILVKLKISKRISKKNIKLKYNKKLIKFHFEANPFNKPTKKIVFNLPDNTKQKVTLFIKKQRFNIFIVKGKEEFEIKSKIPAWAYLELRFWNINFIRFLEEVGGDKKNVRLNFNLINQNKYFALAVISALIDAEGCLTYYKFFRRISIRMRSKDYLKDVKKLLDNYKVGNTFYSWKKQGYIESAIIIEGWQDFNKLKELGLSLYHSKKSQKFNIILNSYKRNQISRGTAFLFYVDELKKINKPITAREFSEKIGKSKRVVNHYLTKLMKQNLINVDKSNISYLYSSK